jgi:beta-galactosidase
MTRNAFRAGLMLPLLACSVAIQVDSVHAQIQGGGNTVRIDASQLAAPPNPLPFPVGGQSPQGHSLSANSRYLIRDGQPWFPVMGEFHFSRYPESGWEEQILKMKAGGIQIISTYIFWIHHEEIEGQFDWTGQRSLREFVKLCAKHGMYVWIRVGPWAHGEVRNGGLPDWLVKKCKTRQNDPQYLNYVQRFFKEISQQTDGLYWKQGGPIIGVQIENEYHGHGPGQGAEHMLTLLQLVREAGIDAPYYTATAWDAAEVPAKHFLPVFGGYGDAFWSRSLDQLPPNANFFFTAIRSDENVGDDLRSKRPDLDARYANYPFLTAEMGGGMAISYHRRPLMTADDTAAMALVKIGSGVVLTGYYMFQGGTNPDGKRTTLQESQDTGYPNDLPIKWYDFQAPLGAFGQENSSYRNLKTLHLFLNDFGSSLTPMTSYFPDAVPASKTDTATPRVAARFEKDHGFVFINNYQRNYPLPASRQFQIRLKTVSGEINIPSRPISIPGGAYIFWPVNLDLGGILLRYATAQPLCKLDQLHTYVFFAWPGLPPEFSFVAAPDDTIEAAGGRVVREHGSVHVDQIRPGRDFAIHFKKADGREVEILVLTREMARNAWRATLDGQERLLLSPADVFFEGDAIHLLAADPAQLNFEILPRLDRAPTLFTSLGPDGQFERYATHVGKVNVKVRIEQVKDAAARPPARMGKEVVEVPETTVFEGAAEWALDVPTIHSSAVHSLLLRISYEGDIARLYSDGKLINDDFYKGTPFEIGMSRLNQMKHDLKLELQILPMRKDEPIYLPPGSQPTFPPSGQVATLKEIVAIPEYQAVASVITPSSAALLSPPETKRRRNLSEGSPAEIPQFQQSTQPIENILIDGPH